MDPSSSDDDHVISETRTTIAVAIGTDKNSPHAVKWAVNNLLGRNYELVLIHVFRGRFLQNRKNLVSQKRNPKIYQESIEHSLQLFRPYRAYCSRKGVPMKEVVLDDCDVSKALLDYLEVHRINNIVVGASVRSSISRNPDVATCLTKSTPDFRKVYIVSEGKIVPTRSDNHPNFQSFENSKLGDDVNGRGCSDTSGEPRKVPKWSSNMLIRTQPRVKTTRKNLVVDSLDLSVSIPRMSFSRDSLLSFGSNCTGSSSLGFESLNIDDSEKNEFSLVFDDSHDNNFSTASQFSQYRKVEMKRLRQELNQTMDLYSTACKEEIPAKQKAQQLHQCKIDEGLKFEEARHAEDAALAFTEMENVKCRAAIEAAQAAQKLAEMEVNRRKQAELKVPCEAEEKMRAVTALNNNDVRYRRYTIDEIEAATNSFADSLKIGEGGYGPVYKAMLDHTLVAIKVLRPDARQGKQQFQQEVQVLSTMRHPNMVLLMGACPEYGCLVYEYMENGSLEDRLFRKDNTPTIPWNIRFKIAAEIATALLFLHQTKPEPLVHRDLKPANILLDCNYASKIGDVGLARLVPPSFANSVTQCRITSAAGTLCYIDPEYQHTGKLFTKSDVYSLGIMLLQIITGSPPMGIKHHVENAIENGTFEEIIDPTVPDWPIPETLEYAKVALKCAELRRKERPDLGSEVLPVLNRLRNLGSKAESKIYTSPPPTYDANSWSMSTSSSQIRISKGWKKFIYCKSFEWKGKASAQRACCFINGGPTSPPIVVETNKK